MLLWRRQFARELFFCIKQEIAEGNDGILSCY